MISPKDQSVMSSTTPATRLQGLAGHLDHLTESNLDVLSISMIATLGDLVALMLTVAESSKETSK